MSDEQRHMTHLVHLWDDAVCEGRLTAARSLAKRAVDWSASNGGVTPDVEHGLFVAFKCWTDERGIR